MIGIPSLYAIRARYVFPVSSPPLPGGVVTVREGRIASVGENLSGSPPRDLGNVALLPGLVNAHTHLEFSNLAAPLGTAGMRFADWIRLVIEYRRNLPEPARSRASAVAAGLAEAEARGTAALGEIATPDWPQPPFSQAGVSATVFLELLGLRAEQSENLLPSARAHLAQSAGAAWRAGLSPHAPYTAPLEVVRGACRMSAESRTPIAMHLAETIEELELLASHSGALWELLSEHNAWDPVAVPRGIRPLDYLHVLAEAGRALVVHGNYLGDRELAFLAEKRGQMSLVYCPRTHFYFGHGKYPLGPALAAGVNVALGTDSRASNPDLCLWSEMRFVACHFAELAPEDVLRLGTQNGACALGIEQDFGSLERGKRAAFCVLPLPDHAAGDPYELLFESAAAPSRLPWNSQAGTFLAIGESKTL